MLMMVLQRRWRGASHCITFTSFNTQVQWYLDQRAVCVLSIPLMSSLPPPPLLPFFPV